MINIDSLPPPCMLPARTKLFIEDYGMEVDGKLISCRLTAPLHDFIGWGGNMTTKGMRHVKCQLKVWGLNLRKFQLSRREFWCSSWAASIPSIFLPHASCINSVKCRLDQLDSVLLKSSEPKVSFTKTPKVSYPNALIRELSPRRLSLS